MFTIPNNRRVLLAALCVAAACTKEKDAEPNADSAAMANMPGMAGRDAKADSAARPSTVVFTSAQTAHARVKWAAPITTAIAATVEVPGQLVQDEDHTARLAAPAQARVLALHVSPGDRVEKGARLVTLQSQDAALAQSDVAKAIAELAARRAEASYAKAAKDRAERLLALKSIPLQDYERAVADDELARTGLTQAEAELERSRSNAAQLGVDPATGAMILRAPFSGVITTRDIVPGVVVSPGTQLVTVIDPSTLWLAISVPESFASGIRVGSAVRFTVPAVPADTFSARIQSVSATFDPVTRSLPVRALVANQRGQLRPEMYARAWVEGGARSSGLTVSDSAIQRLEGKTAVFIARPDAKGGARFEAREVQVGTSSGGRTVILRGLTATDLVVMQGAFAVKSEMTKSKMPDMEN